MTVSGSTPMQVTHLYHHPDARALARSLGEGFQVVECAAPPAEHAGFYLWAGNDHLELRRGRERSGAYVSLDELARRAARGGELLRACGARGERPRLLDAMAGWGVDGLVLAGRGFAVTMLERHPVLHALAGDLLRRSGLGGVTCRCADGFAALSEQPPYDVAYLDPMFPARRKGALPGKRMQWLAELATPDARPLSQWVEAAICGVRQRVVVKRRRTDAAVLPPDWRIVGTTVRYDVYRGRGGDATGSRPDQASCRTA
jgi:16S rRNA (guanine1516-N2)-methyltransferase